MAIYHPPRAPRSGYRVISAAARQSIAEAARLLYDDVPGLVGDEALAERERMRLAAAEVQLTQPELPLCGPAPLRVEVAPLAADRLHAPLNINEYLTYPGDGSSLEGGAAGNSDPVSRVDSGLGSY